MLTVRTLSLSYRGYCLQHGRWLAGERHDQPFHHDYRIDQRDQPRPSRDLPLCEIAAGLR